MKIDQHHSEPDHVKDREPYRIRIEGKDGQAIEIIEQTRGGFSVTAVTKINSKIVITPLGMNSIFVEVK